MRVFNTLTRVIEELVPIEGNHVRMYTCGPTVYDYAHIGNFRAYVFEDILRRTLKYAGFRVTQVMNLTDVDDKTIRGARSSGMPLAAYTQKFKDAFFQDLRILAIEPAEYYPAATDHIPEMIALIGRLFERGLAYRSDDGSVYFNVRRFPDYGKLAHLDLSGLRGGARVSHDEYDKEHVADFALWKAWDAEDGDVAWDSPWGRGRPGWHIECSAMSMKYLGESFDIHTGGVDNIFPHHENEIAQSEGATGKPFVKYWLHCEHLRVDGQKMSKSLGNFYTLRDLLARGYTGRELRYVLLAGHYRQPLNFTFEAAEAARAALGRLDDFRLRLTELAGNAGPVGLESPSWLRHARLAFRQAMEDDLNTPQALAVLFDLVRLGHKAMDDGTLLPSQAADVLETLRDFDTVLGGLTKEEEAIPGECLTLVRQREEARRRKNWTEADRLREELRRRGWEVRDTPDGPKLRRCTP
ncbi:MAG: cysteine--tRNA ligase [Kiritimatiellae bacterium]|nr:cysteine--tRNA ligase [Kiritimatiellia bacterium]